jgi:hypothetical protein
MPDPSTVKLFFNDRPKSTEWWIMTMAGQTVEHFVITGPNGHSHMFKNYASGLYLLRVHVEYADGIREERTFKVMFIH